ncbi:serine hydrolase domain-containing protein [Flavobacterium hauense]
MKNRITLALGCFFIALTTFAQVPDKTKLDQYFAALEANDKFMGTVAVSQNGKTIYTKSIGFADKDKNQKINENTKFRIGSISKTFTAVLIFKAIEEKKLKLTDNLSAYFPTIPNASKITIAQMLNHHSGIHSFTDDEDYTSWMTQAKTEAELVAIIAKAPADFEPGTQGNYSNSNYVLLSYILEKTYKKPFKAIADEKIIKPLGLKNTYFGGKINPASNEAYSYEFDGSWAKSPETDMSVPMGAGAMVSNPNDLSRFIEALFAGKLITMENLEQMKTISDDYGMGLFMIPFNHRKGYGHTGGIDGFSSMLAYFPEDKVTFALTSNGNSISNNDIAIAALSWVFNQPFEIPSFKTFAYTDAELNAYTGTYTTSEMPVSFIIAKNGSTLTAQASGQGAFPIESSEKNIFKFDAAGITITFKPETKSFLIVQGGHGVTFTKKE